MIKWGRMGRHKGTMYELNWIQLWWLHRTMEEKIEFLNWIELNYNFDWLLHRKLEENVGFANWIEL